jgi:hypothetical protein
LTEEREFVCEGLWLSVAVYVYLSDDVITVYVGFILLGHIGIKAPAPRDSPRLAICREQQGIARERA